MLPQLAVLKLVAAKLDQAGIKYMMTGSMAAGYYGEPRMTREIDIVADMQPSDTDAIIAAFGKDFYTDADTIRAAITSRAAFNLIHVQAVVKIDFIVRKATPHAIEEFERRREIVVDGASVSIVTPEDLILAKLVWAKDSRTDRHVRDIKQIMAAATMLDWAYLDRWSRALKVRDQLAELREA